MQIVKKYINKKDKNKDGIYRICWNSELHTSYNVNLPVFLYVRTLELKYIKLFSFKKAKVLNDKMLDMHQMFYISPPLHQPFFLVH